MSEWTEKFDKGLSGVLGFNVKELDDQRIVLAAIPCSNCGHLFIPAEQGIHQCSDNCYRNEHCIDD